jgi:predicted nuclease with RNAse H fold
MAEPDLSPSWLGVDVGGPGKGFDIAVIDDREVLELRARLGTSDVAALVESARPAVVGIDSPRSCAPNGETSREGERRLARAVCGIRWTPDRARVHASDYYGWVVEGLRLYAALAPLDVVVIEVFPTASWTRWLGPRAGTPRSAWSTDGLAGLGLAGIPARTNQDQRDALAAAVTARLHSRGATEAFGEIYVPRQGRSRRFSPRPR